MCTPNILGIVAERDWRERFGILLEIMHCTTERDLQIVSNQPVPLYLDNCC